MSDLRLIVIGGAVERWPYPRSGKRGYFFFFGGESGTTLLRFE